MSETDARTALAAHGLASHADSLVGRLHERFGGGDRVNEPTAFRARMLALLAGVAGRYAANALPYHNVDHLRDCLDVLAAARSSALDAEAVELALWYHDVIYDPECADNEARSAELAERELVVAGLPSEWVEGTAELVLATQHLAADLEGDAALICDVDLSILGRPADAYARYARAIHDEYCHVADAAFAAGRAKVLRRLLERPRLFGTEAFRDQFEAPARANLQSELQRLTQS